MVGYDDSGHVFYGITATVLSSKQFQNATNDEWYWSALIEYDFLGETTKNYYPEKYLSLKEA
jgi:hypothetical protein